MDYPVSFSNSIWQGRWGSGADTANHPTEGSRENSLRWQAEKMMRRFFAVLTWFWYVLSSEHQGKKHKKTLNAWRNMTNLFVVSCFPKWLIFWGMCWNSLKPQSRWNSSFPSPEPLQRCRVPAIAVRQLSSASISCHVSASRDGTVYPNDLSPTMSSFISPSLCSHWIPFEP